MVDRPFDRLALAATGSDEDHRVRKAYRRILRAWSKSDPEAMSAWASGVKGGFPKMLKPEIDRAHRLAKRAAAEAEAGEE